MNDLDILVPESRRRLSEYAGKFSKVAKAAGGEISYSYIQKFHAGVYNNPSVDFLRHLHAALDQLDSEKTQAA